MHNLRNLCAYLQAWIFRFSLNLTQHCLRNSGLISNLRLGKPLLLSDSSDICANAQLCFTSSDTTPMIIASILAGLRQSEQCPLLSEP